MNRIDNGTYTIEGPKGRVTIRIRTKLAQYTRNPENVGKRLVEILTGPDNTADYTGIGWLEERGGLSHFLSFRAAERWHKHGRYAILILGEGGRDGYTIHAATTCRRCNRELTVPESIRAGLGPECAGR